MTLESPDRRSVMHLALAAAGASLIPATTTIAHAESAMSNDPQAHAFDLFHGSWHVRHRRLKERLAGSTEWIEFDGTCVMQPMLGGLANVDENTFNFPPGPFRGVTLRAYDPATKNWAIWWLDGRFPNKIDVPVVGSFKDGVGTFLADEMFKDRPITVRFIWSRITRDTREWEQAFSPDGGKSWETNWTSSFRRTG